MKYWRKLITMYIVHGGGTQLVRERIGLWYEKYIVRKYVVHMLRTYVILYCN